MKKIICLLVIALCCIFVQGCDKEKSKKTTTTAKRPIITMPQVNDVELNAKLTEYGFTELEITGFKGIAQENEISNAAAIQIIDAAGDVIIEAKNFIAFVESDIEYLYGLYKEELISMQAIASYYFSNLLDTDLGDALTNLCMTDASVDNTVGFLIDYVMEYPDKAMGMGDQLKTLISLDKEGATNILKCVYKLVSGVVVGNPQAIAEKIKQGGSKLNVDVVNDVPTNMTFAEGYISDIKSDLKAVHSYCKLSDAELKSALNFVIKNFLMANPAGSGDVYSKLSVTVNPMQAQIEEMLEEGIDGFVNCYNVLYEMAGDFIDLLDDDLANAILQLETGVSTTAKEELILVVLKNFAGYISDNVDNIITLLSMGQENYDYSQYIGLVSETNKLISGDTLNSIYTWMISAEKTMVKLVLNTICDTILNKNFAYPEIPTAETPEEEYLSDLFAINADILLSSFKGCLSDLEKTEKNNFINALKSYVVIVISEVANEEISNAQSEADVEAIVAMAEVLIDNFVDLNVTALSTAIFNLIGSFEIDGKFTSFDNFKWTIDSDDFDALYDTIKAYAEKDEFADAIEYAFGFALTPTVIDGYYYMVKAMLSGE